jgi:recombination protein U
VFWDRAKNGGRKSFRHDELDEKYIIAPTKDAGILVPYLDAMSIDLEARE